MIRPAPPLHRFALLRLSLLAALLFLAAGKAGAWSTWECPGSPGYRVTWPNDQVWPLRFLSNSPPGSDLYDEIDQAAWMWNAVYGAYDELAFTGGGYGYCTSLDGEGFGVVGWDDGACHNWSPDELGVTRAWTTGCVVDRMSLYVNANAWFPTDDDLLYTALHELGHYQGADHSWYELSVMGYSDSAPFPWLAAPDHAFLRGVYGSGASATPDYYLSRVGLRDVILPGSASLTELDEPTCSGPCWDLQPGDTVAFEVAYGSAGTQSFSNVVLRMSIGPNVLGEWTWSASGWSQAQSQLIGVVPDQLVPGTWPLVVEINPDGTHPESNGPTPPNWVSVPGFTVGPPAAWTCSASWYGDGTYCDCGCGVIDSDCTPGHPVTGCPTEVCSTATCSAQGTCVSNDNTNVCDDGAWCTVVDQCSLGECQPGSPRDCSAQSGPCRVGACDEGADACVGLPIHEGESCDDGAFCTVATMCTAGECLGAPRDCSHLDGVCTVGSCNEGADTCDALPANEGGTCDDGDLCTDNDQCGSGSCQGTPKSCAHLAGPCEIAFCDAATGACVVEPAQNGSPCDDGAFCTDGDSCQAGQCVPGPARDCSGATSACTLGVCDEDADQCAPLPTNEGGSCDDGSLCSLADTCAAGICTGTPVDCSGLDETCRAGACDPSSGACVQVPAHTGGSCDDNDLCTHNDQCQPDGSCTGADTSCDALDDACSVGRCDAATGDCVAEVLEDGTSCDDDNPCTVATTCSAGVCGGGGILDCSGLNNECTQGVCIPEAGGCFAAPAHEGAACGDGSDPCVFGSACQQGECVGARIDCSAFGGPCTVGTCDGQGGCTAAPVADGTSCNVDPCLQGESCSGGECTGGALRDCSALDGPCVEGLCDGELGGCVAVPIDGCETDPEPAPEPDDGEGDDEGTPDCACTSAGGGRSAGLTGLLLLAGLGGLARRSGRRRG